MPSLLVKYSESSSRFPPRVTPEIFAAMSAGPSLALWKCEMRFERRSPFVAELMASAVACSGCCAEAIMSFNMTYGGLVD